MNTSVQDSYYFRALLPKRLRVYHGLLPITLCLLSFATAEHCLGQSAREWVSRDGKFKIDATFVDQDNVQVRLRRSDSGKILAVPLEKLSKADIDYLKSIATPLEKKPGDVNFAIRQIDAASVRLGDCCTVGIPLEGATWKLKSTDPLAYELRLKDSVKATLTILPKHVVDRKSRDSKFAVVSRFYESCLSDLKKENLKIFGSAPKLEDVGQSCSFGIGGADGKRAINHSVLVRFDLGRTFVICHRHVNPGDDEDINKFNTSVISGGLHNIVDPTDPDLQIPKDLKLEIKAYIEKVLACCEEGNFEELIRFQFSPDDFESLKADSKKFKEAIEYNRRYFDDVHRSRLREFDVEKALWDGESSLWFPSDDPYPFDVYFKKLDGRRWTLVYN